MSYTPPSHSAASGGSFDVFQHTDSMVSVLRGVDTVLGDGHGALHPGNKMAAGFYYRNWILGI